MKKSILLIAVLLFAAVGLYAQNMAAAVVRHKKTEPIAANDVMANIQGLEIQNGRPLTAEERKYVLETMIDSVLLIQEAESDRSLAVTQAEVDQAAMSFLAQQMQMSGDPRAAAVASDKAAYYQIFEEVAPQMGMTREEFEAQVRNQIMVEKLIAAREADTLEAIGPATQQELTTLYQAEIQSFAVGDSVYFNHIFFTTQNMTADQARAKEDKAREVYNRLMNTPATFPELVATESEDEQSKINGGQTGPLVKGNPYAMQVFGQEFIDTVFAMNIGDISEPLQSAGGYHIVQLTRKEAARLLPMDDPEVRRYLEQVIYANKFQQAFEQGRVNVAESIRETATINYIGEYANW